VSERTNSTSEEWKEEWGAGQGQRNNCNESVGGGKRPRYGPPKRSKEHDPPQEREEQGTAPPTAQMKKKKFCIIILPASPTSQKKDQIPSTGEDWGAFKKTRKKRSAVNAAVKKRTAPQGKTGGNQTAKKKKRLQWLYQGGYEKSETDTGKRQRGRRTRRKRNPPAKPAPNSWLGKLKQKRKINKRNIREKDQECR